MTKRIWIAALMVWAASPWIFAQEDPPSEKVTPLEVELALSPAPDGRESGTSFKLYVLADSKRAVVLRAGREVAVPAADNQYRNVGTNVTCRAWASGDGFRLDVDIERSSLADGSDPGRPSFHTFNVNSTLLLRDGESVEIAAGADLRAVVAKLRVLRD